MAHTVVVSQTQPAARLDKFLSGVLTDLSRSRLQALIEQGHVARGTQVITDSAHKVKPGEIYQVTIPDIVPSHIRASDTPLTIVYEDDDMLVIDKPAGMTVHPAPGHRDDTLVNALLAHCGATLSGIGGVARPGIVHRIDKDTSGLLVIAKHDEAHKSLAAQLAKRTLKRVYQCVVWGVPKPLEGSISGAIGRSPKNRKKMALVKSGGKEALTYYKVLEVFGGATNEERGTTGKRLAPRSSLLAAPLASFLECRLETGRTHQIRVHFSSKGHSLVGDQSYGSNPTKKRVPIDFARDFPRQALHAAELALLHPTTGKPMEFLSPLPEDIKALRALFRAWKNAS